MGSGGTRCSAGPLPLLLCFVDIYPEVHARHHSDNGYPSALLGGDRYGQDHSAETSALLDILYRKAYRQLGT